MKKLFVVVALLMSGTLVVNAQSHDEHEGHDHATEPVPHDHDGDGVSDHETHDSPDEHEGHDHGEEASGGGVALTSEMMQKVGIKVYEAESGTVSRSSIFPAEIKLNRDTTVAVSPRYPSIVLEVFAEIGDSVRAGDVLASLENRETMAVYTVAAPRDGVIISKDLAPGETAGDDQVLFEVADLSSVWADISVFPQYQHLLRKGMPVTFIAHDGHTARGFIRYISPIVSHETRTFTARCILEGADEDFTPGAFVRARINIESVDASVVISREAVQTLEGEQVVFVPSENGFITAPVKLGLTDEINAQVLSGLHEGDKYVAVGAFALKAQMITSGMDPHAGHGH
ncbi:efflux RND transporter periplasmic adaptor subunit [Pontiellaceae bacterium B12219]|nr:efflux RND transporter periplasmic adaptor subunit [Pontiellaceae bacterium B12219]